MKIMQAKGHEFAFVARDKEVLHTLLLNYNIDYTNRGRGGKSLLGKLFYMFYADYVIYRVAKKFKPDIFLSFASTYAAHVSRLCGKPHIVLDDTEHAKFELMMYPPFSDVILNPSVFWKKFSRKQIFFESYMELFYLNPKYFTPDISIINSYGLAIGEKYFIIRFVSWNASHDIGQKGLSSESKIKLVKSLEKHGRVLISSEGSLPDALKSYQIIIRPEHLHHFLAFAALYVGEGSTTASECSVLGTPNIYVNTLIVSNCKEQQEKYGLSSHLVNESEVIAKSLEIINNQQTHLQYQTKRQVMLKDKIDGTSFLVWFVENYPQSEEIMRKNPDYQYIFK
jgi:hypothetical protein